MKLKLDIHKPDLRSTDEPREIDSKTVVAAESSSACSMKKESGDKRNDS